MALLWSNLDREHQTLSVSKQIVARDGQPQITRPKTETSIRQISVSQETIELLLREHKKHPDSPYMFPSPKTGGMYHLTLHRADVESVRPVLSNPFRTFRRVGQGVGLGPENRVGKSPLFRSLPSKKFRVSG